jgi:diguanylate cyclase (GGDEF)-like protein/PAS domain S-box-containing protein
MNDRADTAGLPGALARRVLELSETAISVVDARDPAQPAVWVNHAFEALTGFAADEVLGRNLRFLQGGDREQPGLVDLRDALERSAPCRVLLRNYRRDGALFWNELRLEPVRDEGGGAWWVGFSRDHTERRQMEADLGRNADELQAVRARLSVVDPGDRLTGLQNARSFEAALERAWFICARDGRSLVLFVFAPDYFEAYGETFGRIAGDSCLRMVARAVGGGFRRASDAVARLEGEIFAALAVDMDPALAEDHARRICGRVRGLAIHNPRAPGGRYLTLSAGIALARPSPDGGWRELLQVARGALAEGQKGGWEQLRVLGGEQTA